jgi:phage terminase large subunit GpA-like protein
MSGFRFTADERRILARRPFLSVSDWSAKHLVVQDGPYKGAPLRVAVTPYLGAIMDAYSDPAVEQVIVCGSPQTGKTLAMYACLCYSMDRRSGTKMLTMPDDKNVARIEAEKLRPLFRGSTLVSSLIAGSIAGHVRLRDGTSVFLSSAQAPAQRASITVRDLFMDEEDLYLAVAGRGNPVMDFIERTRSYSFRRKIMRVSKPVGDMTSSIWRALTNDTDLCLSYEVDCPFCGLGQFFLESNVTVASGIDLTDRGMNLEEGQSLIRRQELGRYRCPGCGALWNDLDRNRAVAGGRWRPSRARELGDSGVPAFEPFPEDGRRARSVGFHLPAILSRTVGLSELAARKWMAARSDEPDFLQGQANGDWARPYVAVVMSPKEAEIRARFDHDLPARSVPAGAIALTAGIDTQKVGFYFLVMAWMPDFTKYVIDYGRLSSFEDVRRLVWETTWPVIDGEGRPSGNAMELWRAAIDSGGTSTEGVYSRTEEVYEFVRMEGNYRLFAVKGASREQSIHVRQTVLDRLPGVQTRIIGGLSLYTLDTWKFKAELFSALLNPDNSKPIRVYGHDPEVAGEQAGIHDDLIRHLTSERQVRSPNGQLIWVQDHRDNHYLDCLVMAGACGHPTWGPSLHIMAHQLREDRLARAQAEARPVIKPDRHKPRKSRLSAW